MCSCSELEVGYPAYDVVPTPEGSDGHAISLGRYGITASRDNLVSECGRFGLGSEEANATINQTIQVTAGWQDHFAACGVSGPDITRIGRCVGRIT